MHSYLNFVRSKTSLWLMASVTMGLAPFFPEPHIWGKLKWIAGGALDMKIMDYMDLLMHGSPWILLIFSLLLKLKKV